MKGIILACTLAFCLAVISAEPLSAHQSQLWESFKTEFQKTYSHPREELLRQRVFLNNINAIEEHNKLYEQGKKTFSLKLNKFADLTNKEFKERMNGLNKQVKNSQVKNVYSASGVEDLPKSVDWRDKGAVTGIKDQGQCGSCWAFSTTGSLEGQHFLKTGKLVSLSEQNLMDCSTKEGNMGCNGGLMDYAFEYIISAGGLDTEESYPYEEEDNTCRFKKSNIGATMVNYTDVEAKSEKALQSAIANIGPISVAIDAGEFSFQFYSSGIYYEDYCDEDALDHGVLAVGYGSSSKGDYYIVKNSWGEDWGDSGYILMARNKNNNCGIATQASYPTV